MELSRIGWKLAFIGSLAVWLAGCGVAAVVGATATVTGQAVKTTSKAAGTAARATIGGARLAGRAATRPFRRDDAKQNADE